jgi:hypothetical protein
MGRFCEGIKLQSSKQKNEAVSKGQPLSIHIMWKNVVEIN